MDVELPDGTVIEGVPEGTTKAQLMAKLKASGYDVSKLMPAESKFRFASPEVEQAGVGAIGRAAQAAEEFFTKPVAPAPAAVQAQGYDPLAGYAERVIGNVPRDVVNIGQGMRALPATARALRDRPLETLGAAGSGMLQGAGQFLTAPAETFAEAPISTLTGLQAANFLRAPSRLALSTAREKATPLIRNALSPKNRFIGETFGSPEIQNALAAAAPGMTVPQALADVNAPLAQAAAESALSVVPTEARAAQLAREQARAGQMAQIAGMPEDLAAAQAARAKTAAANYKEAFRQAAPEIPESLLNRPSVQAAFRAADTIAAETGGAATPMESLHNVKLALDKIVSKPGDFGFEGVEKAAIADTRRQFIKELMKVPEYAAARAKFAEQSVPINRMQVAQELQRAMTAPVTGEATRAGMFAGAVEAAPRTIKRATGQQFFDRLEDILDPSEMKIVNEVRDEFRRNQLAKEQAALGRAASQGATDIASAKISPISHMQFLNRAWTFANTVLKRSLGKIDEKLAVEIGMNMLAPKDLARAIDAAKKYAAETEAMTARARESRRGVTRALPREAAAFGVSFQNAMAPENQNAMAR